MSNYMWVRKNTISQWLLKVFTVSLLSTFVFAQSASAAGILTVRNLVLSNPGVSAGATVTYTFNFKVATTDTLIQSFSAQACTTASGACTTPTGFVNTSSLSQPVGLGDASGWTANNATAGSLRIVKSGDASAPSATTTAVTFNNVTNPTSVGTFWMRMTTYSDAAWTTPVDSATVASSIVNAITVTATVDETLTFCVYNTGGTCADTSTTPVALGTLSIASTKTGTSKMDAATNAVGGLSITYYGDTLKTIVGSSIAAIGGTATTSNIGTSQFGINLAANTTPSVGSAPSGGSVVATTPYDGLAGNVNKFAYLVSTATTPQPIANSAGAPTNSTTLTVSYIANIAGAQAAGSYSTVVTYICAATF
jgi:hypothetical protein